MPQLSTIEGLGSEQLAKVTISAVTCCWHITFRTRIPSPQVVEHGDHFSTCQLKTSTTTQSYDLIEYSHYTITNSTLMNLEKEALDL